jgi:hypothetical protein
VAKSCRAYLGEFCAIFGENFRPNDKAKFFRKNAPNAQTFRPNLVTLSANLSAESFYSSTKP